MKDLDENFFPEWEKRYPGIIRGAVGQAEGEQRFIEEVNAFEGATALPAASDQALTGML